MNLIFDFDGTLVDSFPVILEKAAELINDIPIQPKKEIHIDELREMSSKELIRYLRIPFYKLPGLILKVRRKMRKEIQSLPSFKSLPKVLHQLYKLNTTLAILTSNSKDNVKSWLNYHQLENLFQFIHVESNLFGKKKALQNMITSHHFDKDKTFYIGDETRDIEAANRCHIQSIAVTWGFNTENALLKSAPDYIVKTSEELLDLISNLMKA